MLQLRYSGRPLLSNGTENNGYGLDLWLLTVNFISNLFIIFISPCLFIFSVMIHIVSCLNMINICDCLHYLNIKWNGQSLSWLYYIFNKTLRIYLNIIIICIYLDFVPLVRIRWVPVKDVTDEDLLSLWDMFEKCCSPLSTTFYRVTSLFSLFQELILIT